MVLRLFSPGARHGVDTVSLVRSSTLRHLEASVSRTYNVLLPSSRASLAGRTNCATLKAPSTSSSLAPPHSVERLERNSYWNSSSDWTICISPPSDSISTVTFPEPALAGIIAYILLPLALITLAGLSSSLSKYTLILEMSFPKLLPRIISCEPTPP